MDEATARYVAQGHLYLDQALREFADEDYRQASEKAWGSAAQLAKAAAQERGWRHHSHGSLFTVVRRLAGEADDEELEAGFDAASTLHANFYEGFLQPDGIETRINRVARFVGRVELNLNGHAANGTAD